MESNSQNPKALPRKSTRLAGWLNRLLMYKSFRGKILIPDIVILVLLVVFLCYYLSVSFLSYCNTFVGDKITANINALKFYIAEAENNTKVAATSMAMNPEAKRAIKNKDRDEIIRIFSSTLDFYRVTHYTICDGKGVVLGRTHMPEQFGDLIGNQHNINEALRGRVSTVFEYGSVVKVAIRTGAPVFDADGALVGVVSAGVRFDTDEAVDGLRDLFNADVSIILGETRIATTLRDKDGQRIVGTKMDPHIAKIVVDDKIEHLANIKILGENHKAFYMPVLDSNGKAFATFFVGESTSALNTKINSLIRRGVAIGLIGLMFSIGLLTIIITVLSKDVIILAKDMNGVARGNLDIKIDINRDDEVGRLAKSMRKVVGIIHKLIQDINTMIAEREKGNTDYRLDADAFQGEFKALAGNILKLSDVGVRDHLTGLPNRRSFDNRFELEWSHAKRDRKAMSLLMLDLDGFKKYNDTFGHQQGDVALQEAANAILRAVKRGVDFAARWGGEEFVVLLPNTVADGAMTVASNIRREIENMVIPCTDEGAAKITVSIGVNTQKPTQDSSLELFISGADDALYRAKQAGRNRAVHWENSQG